MNGYIIPGHEISYEQTVIGKLYLEISDTKTLEK
jgi:hypothetical protein